MSIAFLTLLLQLTPPLPAAGPPAPLAPDTAAAPAGLYAWVDPETGKLRVTPPAGEAPLWVPDPIEQAMSTSSDGLVERTLPSGAVALDLEGRFHHALFATAGSDGRARYGHEAETMRTGPESQADTHPVVKEKP